MKRGKPLTRRTPLAARTPIQRCTGEPKARKAPRKTGKHAGEQRARQLVRERSGGRCEVANVGCTGRAAEWSHRKNRSQGGRWTAGNGLDACSSCHAWITVHPAGARAKGWNVSRDDDPLLVPVLHALHGLIVVDDAGGFVPFLPLGDIA